MNDQPNVPFCRDFFIAFTVDGELKDKVLNLSTATRLFKQKLDEVLKLLNYHDIDIYGRN